eukprot:14464025-Ditylum_brightwellii.AAC.1
MHLTATEWVEADDGYIGQFSRHIKCPAHFTNPSVMLHMQQCVRNQQESINNRFKFWGILREMFHHDPTKHADAFHAIAVICQ